MLDNEGSNRLNKSVVLLIVVLMMSQQLVAEVTFPFAPFMVQDFHITTEDRIGYYVGFIAASFGLCQIFSRLNLFTLVC